MTIDIFEFWNGIGRSEKVHPVDREVFERLGLDGHSFNHNTLPLCFGGPLRSACVVLLYMSPGYHPSDEVYAKTREGRDNYVRRRRGNEPLGSADTPGGRWWRERTRCFRVDDKIVATNLSILNIGAYHSKEMKDPQLLAALPSSRVSLDWAQAVLFPDAVAGKRVVVCMRAAKFWGLREGRAYGRALFAPEVTRRGHMVHNELRERVIQAVRTKLLKVGHA
jgi:hypothetical protein